MKDYIKTIPAITFVLLYLFFCGGLYLIGYWETFHVNFFDLISIWDFPKNFVNPFASTFIFLICYQILVHKFYARLYIKSFKARRQKLINLSLRMSYLEWRRRKKIKLLLFDIFYFLLIATMVIIYPYMWDNGLFWAASGTLISMGLLNIVFWIKRKLRLNFDKRFMLPLLMLLIIAPLYSFISGKMNALYVYNNARILRVNKSIIANITDTTNISSLKLLGFLDGNVIVSDINNYRIFLLKTLEDKPTTGIEIIIPPIKIKTWWKSPKSDSTQLKN